MVCRSFYNWCTGAVPKVTANIESNILAGNYSSFRSTLNAFKNVVIISLPVVGFGVSYLMIEEIHKCKDPLNHNMDMCDFVPDVLLTDTVAMLSLCSGIGWGVFASAVFAGLTAIIDPSIDVGCSEGKGR